ncbi:MAG TPA: SET domain-containing protein-lysine N-methyltransferase [Flavitalea sp.]|nr:SET domain-containing protein-lysine N-methyltransferase [Flavitalea sp.]
MEKGMGETVVIGESKFGRGIFTTTALPPDTVILKITGRPMSFRETVALGHHESHSMQIGLQDYILVEAPFLFSNHSCDPNCGINKDLEMITIKTVAAGEELTWDYSTSMLERHWTLKCHCGAAFCRGIVRDFDLIPLHIQNKYLHYNIVLPFIIDAVKNPSWHQQEVFSVR